jgi:hypothetical protein
MAWPFLKKINLSLQFICPPDPRPVIAQTPPSTAAQYHPSNRRTEQCHTGHERTNLWLSPSSTGFSESRPIPECASIAPAVVASPLRLPTASHIPLAQLAVVATAPVLLILVELLLGLFDFFLPWAKTVTTVMTFDVSVGAEITIRPPAIVQTIGASHGLQPSQDQVRRARVLGEVKAREITTARIKRNSNWVCHAHMYMA